MKLRIGDKVTAGLRVTNLKNGMATLSKGTHTVQLPEGLVEFSCREFRAGEEVLEFGTDGGPTDIAGTVVHQDGDIVWLRDDKGNDHFSDAHLLRLVNDTQVVEAEKA